MPSTLLLAALAASGAARPELVVGSLRASEVAVHVLATVKHQRFREGRGFSEPAAAYGAYVDGRQQLEMLRRQASISQMFPQGKHAMESGDATDTDLRYGGHLKDK